MGKKKKKKKVVKYPGGKRAKGQHKSKASKSAGKKTAPAQKKKGVGLFAVKTLSADLAAICGKNKMARPDVVKSIWAYIKKNKLNKGRTMGPRILKRPPVDGLQFSTSRRGSTPGSNPGPSHGRPGEEARPSPPRAQQDPPGTRLRERTAAWDRALACQGRRTCNCSRGLCVTPARDRSQER